MLVFSYIWFLVVLFFFGGRIPHPSLVLHFYQYIPLWFPIKKKKKTSEEKTLFHRRKNSAIIFKHPNPDAGGQNKGLGKVVSSSRTKCFKCGKTCHHCYYVLQRKFKLISLNRKIKRQGGQFFQKILKRIWKKKLVRQILMLKALLYIWQCKMMISG